MRDDPLIIIGTPRGGTSITAGVFSNHGFWTGKTFPLPEYETFENRQIKFWMKEHFPLRAGVHKQPELREHDLRAFCDTFVPDDVPWMFKGTSEYFPIWKHYFPNLTAVFVFRDLEQAIMAIQKRRKTDHREIARKIITKRYAFMREQLERFPDAVEVDCERIAEGSFEQLMPVFERYGIEFDAETAAQHIDPGKLTR